MGMIWLSNFSFQGIYEVGGRKFAMIGIGKFGCSPNMRALTRNGACSGEANRIAKLHNVALTSILAKLETQLKGFEYSYFDFYTTCSDGIKKPIRMWSVIFALVHLILLNRHFIYTTYGFIIVRSLIY